MYEYHNNILSIPARLLYKDWGLMSYQTYLKLCYRGKLVRTKQGKGYGNEAFVSYKSLPEDIKEICINKLGDPKIVVVRNLLIAEFMHDNAAARFFSEHRKPDQTPLAPKKQREKTTNCIILNAIQSILKDKKKTKKAFGKQKTKIWENISEAVNAIPAYDENDPKDQGWLFSLPGNTVRLKRKYDQYLLDGYSIFIHKGEGTDNSIKIKGEVADFLLATYQLANKPNIVETLRAYQLKREEQPSWPSLTEKGINRWLNETPQKRIWITARDGKDAWRRNFANSISRKKDNWFPNVYWAIDGTKLDLVYHEPEASNKMAAKLKVNVCFDIYSEKIIGYSLSETENHIDHIKAINMALQESQVRPYLLTYDNQSGHKMSRMQELYTHLVARSGGTHFAHRVGQKSNPAEQIFKRLQQQVISTFYNSDKQSIKAKASINQMNEEFIKEYKYDLPTKKEVIKQWELCVKLWNEKPHPIYKTQNRNEVYTHDMPMQEELSLLDIVSMVWISESKRPIKYKRDGLTMRIGDQRYTYEVLNADGGIDKDFRQNIGKSFIVRYNPEYLNEYVQLYEKIDNDMVFVSCAEPKRNHQSVPALMQEGDRERFWQDFKTQEEEYERDRQVSEAIAKRTGITREALIEDQQLMTKMSGVITKKERNAIENIFDHL